MAKYVSGITVSSFPQVGEPRQPLYGTDGADAITGTSGYDAIFAGGGDDVITGSSGRDAVDGGTGYNTYVIGLPYADGANIGMQGVFFTPGYQDKPDYVVNIQAFRFTDGTLYLDPDRMDLASAHFVSAEDMASATRAVTRGGSAGDVGAASQSFDAYLKALVASVDHSTVPALLMAGLVNGQVPSSDKLDALTTFAQQQYDYYANVLGSSFAQLGPYEALGKAFAASGTAFSAKYGSGTDAAFVAKAYADVFGHQANGAQQAALQAQVSYFENLYKGAGMGAAQADLQARGAVYGQIVGYAAYDSAEPYHAKAETLLTGFAAGHAELYGSTFGV